ncbi:hypothetical protein H0H93_005778 [Arthromyces matolae]|nr:hypothetical protein H0H93_005778 [Arthromyces matolae]
MTTLTERAKARLATLTASFDDLEDILEPLFAQTLPETILGLEPIQQAKLQTVIPYLVYDLVFIYLKTKGIDPKTHPVVSELERVKQYFNKISAAENPPQKRTEIDKDAAQRFIKHAIGRATSTKAPAEEEEPSSSSSAQVQTKFTSKMLERQLYEKNLKEQAAQESQEEELEVFGDDDDKADVVTATSKSSKKAKGKAKQVTSSGNEPSPADSNRRKRPLIDPFAGYGDDTAGSTPTVGTPTSSSTPGALQSKKRPLDDSAHESSSGTPASGAEPAKKAKKARKKNKKSET